MADALAAPSSPVAAAALARCALESAAVVNFMVDAKAPFHEMLARMSAVMLNGHVESEKFLEIPEHDRPSLLFAATVCSAGMDIVWAGENASRPKTVVSRKGTKVACKQHKSDLVEHLTGDRWTYSFLSAYVHGDITAVDHLGLGSETGVINPRAATLVMLSAGVQVWTHIPAVFRKVYEVTGASDRALALAEKDLENALIAVRQRHGGLSDHSAWSV
jgi:hypothetical protein